MKGSTKKPAMVAFACAGLCACLLVMLTGCASQPEPFVARIEILADRYDECIKHEIDHVVRGKWHADRRATCR